MQGYILFASPPLFMVSAAVWYKLSGYRGNILIGNKSQVMLKWTINLLLLLFILLPIRYTIERVKPFQKNRKPQWVQDLKKSPKKNLSKGVLFNYDKPIDAMFYTDLIVYNTVPDKKTIQTLQQQGYIVLINDNGAISEDMLSLENVIRVHFTLSTN